MADALEELPLGLDSLAEISSSAGRSRFPPLDCKYCPIAVTASTDATADSTVIFFSTCSSSSWMRSKISRAVKACPSLPKFM